MDPQRMTISSAGPLSSTELFHISQVIVLVFQPTTVTFPVYSPHSYQCCLQTQQPGVFNVKALKVHCTCRTPNSRQSKSATSWFIQSSIWQLTSQISPRSWQKPIIEDKERGFWIYNHQWQKKKKKNDNAAQYLLEL